MLFSYILISIGLFSCAYLFPLQNLIELFPAMARFGMLFSVLMFLPFWICFGGKFSKFEWRDFVAVGVVGLMSYGYELASINFGFPYGKFEYLDLMGGIKVLGEVPLVLPLIYVPMVLGILYLLKGLSFWEKVLGCGFGLMMFDVCIDPGLTAVGVWEWGDAFLPWRLYEVPVQNFIGWFMTGSLSAFVFEKVRAGRFWENFSEAGFWMWVSPITLSVAYWSGVLVREGYWISVGVGSVIMFLVCKKYYEGVRM